MFTARIKDVKRDVLQATQTPFLDVEVEILNEQGEFVATRKFGYPADASEDSIKADLKQLLKTYEEDVTRSESLKEANALNDKAESTANALKGEVIA